VKWAEQGPAGDRDSPDCASVLLSAPGQVPVFVRRLGRRDYSQTWQAMRDFTATRTEGTLDEFWCCEHAPVFTLGQAGKPEHLLSDLGIPLVKTDRGGQITYHGPGQVVVYLLLDLTRRKLKVRELVSAIEQAVIDLLAEHGVAPSDMPARRGSMWARPRSRRLVCGSARAAAIMASA
jgi:lipoate-protein ligase B